jgi:hypothetical protein
VTFLDRIEDPVTRVSALIALVYMVRIGFSVVRWYDTASRRSREHVLHNLHYCRPEQFFPSAILKYLLKMKMDIRPLRFDHLHPPQALILRNPIQLRTAAAEV